MRPEVISRQSVIATGRISLRPFHDSDASLVAQYANDRRVAQMTTSIPFPLSFEAAEEFVNRSLAADRSEDVWVIDGVAAGGSALLGVVSLKYLDRDQSEIGYWVAPAFWNQGFASEAVNALLGANPHANRSVVASVFHDNPASAKVLTAAGFALLGEAEAFSLARRQHVPTWTYLKTL
ncbi:MAG: RimJ/RimL family protein N-acetyltransferase [Paracoccaceae bacterium]|jgi:RimJ/RimL family protein N-acetyltransferase